MRVGICPVCETKQRLVSRWSNEHRGIRRVIASHGLDGIRYCNGTYRDPLPTPDQKRRAVDRCGLIEPFRIHAAVALDSWIRYQDDPRRYPAPDSLDVDVLCEVALREYSVRNDNAREVEILRYVSRRNRDGSTGSTGDCYCVFCGVLLWRNVSGISYGTERENLRKLSRSHRHPVECALKHLAFALEPAAPHVRKLPDEYMQDNAADERAKEM